jgi:dephospho-CoA kinase
VLRWKRRYPVGRPYVIGLTGSIGMGKSQTAQLFAAENISVHDSDAVLHRLYAKGGAAVDKIASVFPGAVRDGAVDRAALSALVTGDAQKLRQLEELVHPLVAADRDAFLRQTKADIVVLDIPLLFETGAQDEVDAVVVVSAPSEVQRARVLARPGMTAEKFEALHARQLPDAQKRQQAHYVVMTDKGLDHAREQVKMILGEIREKLRHA